MTILILALLAAAPVLSQDNAADSPAPLVIRVQSLKPEQPVQKLQYARKAGVLEKGAYWRTILESTPTSTTWDPTPPRDWQSCENPNRLELDAVEGKEVVFIRAPGFETRAIQIPDSSNSGFSIDIQLAPVAPISGIVVQEDGKGVPDAPIWIGSLPADSYNLGARSWAVTITDKQGRFTVNSYPTMNPLMLTTCAEGFGPGYLVIDTSDDIKNSPIVLHKPISFTGEVQLSSGRVKEMSVMALLLTADGLPYGRLYSESYNKGAFSVENMPPGKAELYISGTSPYLLFLEDYFTHEQEVNVEAEDSATKIIFVNN